MCRLTLVIALVVGNLICPLRCWGALAASVSPTVKKSGCSCCQHKCPADKPARERSPQPAPEDDCGCASCVCHGAVFADVPHLSDGWIVGNVLPHAELVAAVARLTVANFAQHPPPLELAGRSLRVHEQSLVL